MMVVWGVGLAVEPMQFISQFMNTDVPGWVLAIIISTGARWQFCKNDSDKKSTRLVLALYFVAWIAVIATAVLLTIIMVTEYATTEAHTELLLYMT